MKLEDSTYFGIVNDYIETNHYSLQGRKRVRELANRARDFCDNLRHVLEADGPTASFWILDNVRIIRRAHAPTRRRIGVESR